MSARRRRTSRDRRVYRIEDMTPEQLATLEKSEVPGEYAYLDAELRDDITDRPWTERPLGIEPD